MNRIERRIERGAIALAHGGRQIKWRHAIKGAVLGIGLTVSTLAMSACQSLPPPPPPGTGGTATIGYCVSMAGVVDGCVQGSSKYEAENYIEQTLHGRCSFTYTGETQHPEFRNATSSGYTASISCRSLEPGELIQLVRDLGDLGVIYIN